MKKNGFTLVEVLLALAIVGVVAAVTAPVLVGLMPDKRKVEVLKLRKVVLDINQELMTDRSLYMEGFGRNGNEYLSGLADREAPSDPNFAAAVGDCKYPMLLASKLNLKDGASWETACNGFTTTDGVLWEFASAGGENVGVLTITIDPERDAGNYAYGGGNKPNMFRFMVDRNGNVKGNDPLTTAYFKNSMKLNDKKHDMEEAAKDNNSY